MTHPDWKNIRHFTPREFDSPDEPGSGVRMKRTFVEALDLVRSRADFPFHINSGFRTEAHNRAVGGKPNSAHTKGWAADIRVEGSRQRFRIVAEAIVLGRFTRIGIGKTFVHLDADPSLPQEVIWLY